jgi:aminoglycoside 2'-N-acetyltransferase I
MTSVHLDVVPADALPAATRAEIIALCESAYGEDFTRWFEELPGSTHVLARNDDGLLVSHAAWVTRWLQPGDHPVLRTAYIEAVATAAKHQRRGCATAVLQRVGDLIRTEPMWELAALSPSDAGFYARLGWELWRGPLAIRRAGRLEPTPEDDQVMILRLPGTPATLVTTALLTAEWRVGELW